MNPKIAVKEMKAGRESKAKIRSLEEDWGCVTSNAIVRGEPVDVGHFSATDAAPPSFESQKSATPPPPYKGDELTNNEEWALDQRHAWIREVFPRQHPPKSAC